MKKSEKKMVCTNADCGDMFDLAEDGPEAREGGYYYFAYGSNMNAEQMRARCPGAVKVGRGLLPGWTLAERLYADIDPSAGGEVEGVVYRIGYRDLRRLDAYEGYPHVYTDRCLTVLVGNRWLEAITYLMTADARTRREGRPYPPEYRRRCSEGARSNGVRDGFGGSGRCPKKERAILGRNVA